MKRVLLLPVVLLLACEPAPPSRAPGTVDTITGSPADTTTPADSPVAAEPTSQLKAALEETVSGARAQAQATESWFTAETSQVLKDVAIDSVGHAIVDFHDLRPLIPNASSSAGSEMLLNELNAAVFGVSGIRSVEYRMAGSCTLFWEWLQYGCHTVSREDAARDG